MNKHGMRSLYRLLAAMAVTVPLCALLLGCTNVVGAYCSQRKECCGIFYNCNTYQKEGGVDRCIIAVDTALDQYRTYNSGVCDSIVDLMEKYYDCFASHSCEALKAGICDPQSTAVNSAQKSAGAACRP